MGNADEHNGIRVVYSGFIIFIAKLLSILTGFAFTIMVVRALSPLEYGIWGNIGDVLSYFVFFASTIPFWTTRFMARGFRDAARTGVVANILVSAVTSVTYLAAVPYITILLGIQQPYTVLYVIIAAQIPELYILYTLESIIYARRPQLIGYGTLIYEIAKVGLGLIFIVYWKMKIEGAIYSIIIAYVLQILFYARNIWDYLKGKVQWSFIKEWSKGSLVTVYEAIGSRLSILSLILLFSYAGERARAYYGAALTVAVVISHSIFLTYALYPKLLSEDGKGDITTSLRIFFTFSIPMTLGIIVLADSYLTILGLRYAVAKYTLQILSIDIFLFSFSEVLHRIIMGVERVDEEAKIPLRELTKTPIFKTFTLRYVRSIFVVTLTYVILIFISRDYLVAATYVAMIFLISDIIVLILRYIIVRRCIYFKMPYGNIMKYLLSSSFMAVILLIIPHPTRITPTFLVTLLGAVIYGGLLYLLDNETRHLIHSLIKKFKSENV